jgi:SAM-dependent methyltransferase
MFVKSHAFYDAIYAARGKNYPAEAAWLRAAIGRTLHDPSPKPRLLDVACGTGVHLSLLRSHFAVEGVDADPDMIAIARGRLPSVPLYVERMQALQVREPFDVLICLFDSIGYVADLAELHATLARFAAAIRPGGMVVVEPWVHPEDWEDGYLDWALVDQPALKIAQMSISERYGATGVIRFTYLVGEPGGVTSFGETHRLQLFTDAEYRSAFAHARLETTHERSDIFSRGLYIGVKR